MSTNDKIINKTNYSIYKLIIKFLLYTHFALVTSYTHTFFDPSFKKHNYYCYKFKLKHPRWRKTINNTHIIIKMHPFEGSRHQEIFLQKHYNYY